MDGLGWLGPVNEIPYTNEVHFAYADGSDSEDLSDVNVTEEVDQTIPSTAPKTDHDISDIYMNAGEKKLFGFSYKTIGIALVVVFLAYLALKK